MALLIRSFPLLLLSEALIWNSATIAASPTSENETEFALNTRNQHVSLEEQTGRFLNNLWHDYGSNLLTDEGRRRHHYRKVFPILVTGFMIMISLMVPLGFQFMAMIGGKALLMSKMALVLASLQNFKRGNVIPPVYPPPHPVPVATHVSHLVDHHGFHDRNSARIGVAQNRVY